MENLALRSQVADHRFEIERLTAERSLLASRVSFFERFLHDMARSMMHQITATRVLVPYADGVLQAVVKSPQPGEPLPGPGDTLATPQQEVRFAIEQLPSPADKILDALSARPTRAGDVEAIAGEVNLKPSGGHFKRGLATLIRHGLVAQQDRQLRVLGTYVRSK